MIRVCVFTNTCTRTLKKPARRQLDKGSPKSIKEEADRESTRERALEREEGKIQRERKRNVLNDKDPQDCD